MPDIVKMMKTTAVQPRSFPFPPMRGAVLFAFGLLVLTRTVVAGCATVAGFESYGPLTLVDRIACATDTEHRFSEYPTGRSFVTNVLGAACRAMTHVVASESGTSCKCGAYVAWRLGEGGKLSPGMPYLLVVEYPDDAPRTVTLGNRGTGSRTCFHSGFTVGEALNPPYVTQHPEAYGVPLSHSFAELDQVMYLVEKPLSLDGKSLRSAAKDGFDVYFSLYPKEDAPDSVGLALKSISLYRIDDPSLIETSPVYPAEGLPRRYVTWREEMADDPGFASFSDPIDYYRTKSKLMKVLGFNCASRDLLEFGYCQYWDVSWNGYGHGWMWSCGEKDRYWEETVDAFAADGHAILPFYEYSGAHGPSDGPSLGVRKLCRPLHWDTRHQQDYVESVSAASRAQVDITSPEALAEFKKILDCTILRFKNRANFLGAWLRNRGSMPVSFHDYTIARFNVETGRRVTRKEIADAGYDSSLYKAYMNWWYVKRAEFLALSRDYLRTNGVADAVVVFDGDITEPGRIWEGWRNNVAVATNAFYRGHSWTDCVRPWLGRWRTDSLEGTAETWGRYCVRGRYPTYGDREHEHGVPADDPTTYAGKSGVGLALSYGAVYTQFATNEVASYRNGDGRLFLVRHFSLNEDALCGANGDRRLLGYYTADTFRTGRAVMLAELWAVALNDPTDLGYLFGAALETTSVAAMREFHLNFLALPAVRGRVMHGGVRCALQTVRRYDTEKGVYFAVVNTSTEPVTAAFQLSLDRAELTSVAESVGGTVHPVRDGRVTLSLKPLQLLTLVGVSGE